MQPVWSNPASKHSCFTPVSLADLTIPAAGESCRSRLMPRGKQLDGITLSDGFQSGDTCVDLRFQLLVDPFDRQSSWGFAVRIAVHTSSNSQLVRVADMQNEAPMGRLRKFNSLFLRTGEHQSGCSNGSLSRLVLHDLQTKSLLHGLTRFTATLSRKIELPEHQLSSSSSSREVLDVASLQGQIQQCVQQRSQDLRGRQNSR